jgi:hypothetical protein
MPGELFLSARKGCKQKISWKIAGIEWIQAFMNNWPV